MVPPEFRLSSSSTHLRASGSGGSGIYGAATTAAAAAAADHSISNSTTASTTPSSSIASTSAVSQSQSDAHCLATMNTVGLVGRLAERRILQQAHDRVCCRVQQAPSEIVLVEGASGMGKSALVTTVLRDCIESEGMGLLVQGKYDLHSVSPYEAVVDAATELCQAVSVSYYMQDVQEHLATVFTRPDHDDCRLLVNLVPAAQTLLGLGNTTTTNANNGGCGEEDSEELCAAPSHEFALKQFLQVFCKFWNAVASVHPVVLFLDDIQYDPASKDFLTALVNDTSSTNLLIVVAFREGEFDWKPAAAVAATDNNNNNTTTATTTTPQRLRITQIKLGPLSLEHVNEILSRATRRRAEDTIELAEILHFKTNGNALFTWQFVDMLHCAGLLYFCFQTNQFEWAESRVVAQQTDVSDNVAELLAQKMTRLSTRAQTVLMVAACLGHSFDRTVLETIILSSTDLTTTTTNHPSAGWCAKFCGAGSGGGGGDGDGDGSSSSVTKQELSNGTTATGGSTSSSSGKDEEASPLSTINDAERQCLRAGLADAVQAGLIEAVDSTSSSLLDPNGNAKFKFSHDAIQQTAFHMIPAGMDQDVVHAGLGERILQLSRTSQGKDWMLLSAVDLLTRQESTVQASAFSRHELASLCLEASRAALAKSAFITAATYADRGYALLLSGNKDDSTTNDARAQHRRWKSHYSLCLDLCTLSAEMHHSYGDHDGAIQVTSDIIRHAKRIQDKLPAQRVRVASRLSQRDPHGAIRESVAILKERGIKIPEKPHKCHVLFLLVKVKRLLKGRRACDLHDLPQAKDSTMVEAMRVFLDLALAAWMSNNEELTMATCLMLMSLTLTYGVSSYSSVAFVVYGASLSHCGNLDEAYQYGCLAMQVQEKMGTKFTMTRVLGTGHFILEHLRKPIIASLEPLQQAYESGMQAGDVNFAGFCLVVRVILGIHGNMRLDHMETQVRGYYAFLREYQLDTCLNSILPFFQLVLNLRGKSVDAHVLAGEAIGSEADFVQHASQEGDIMPLVHLQNVRMTLLVILDELELADKTRKTGPSEGPMTYFSKCANLFFSGIACLGLARKRKREGKGRLCRYYLGQARKYRIRLDKFVEQGSMNCVPFVRLLEAEALSIKPIPHDRKLKAYQDAITASARGGFRLCKGLACEKAGQYMLEQGKESLAADYLRQAWSEFSDYGALAKLSQMEVRYAGICSFESDDNCSQESSRPSSLTKPHYIQTVMAACK